MKNLLAILMLMVLVTAVMPAVMAVNVGSGIGISITPEAFAPRIWMCDDRVVLEDCVEEGRITDCAETLSERITNYAFEGEQIGWLVLVMDKNKIEEIQEVVGTIGESQGTGNDIEVECHEVSGPDPIPAECNARILEEDLTGTDFNPDTQAYYECLFTVETPDSMHGEYFITIEAISVDGSEIMDENEYWFLNPIVALSVDGDISFDDVRPGSVSYSDTILVGNDAEEGSGVLLDMFISGTDFYDPASSGAKCPTSNRLKLSQTVRSPANIVDDGGSDIGGADAGGANDHISLACNVDTDDAGQNGLDGSSVALATGLTADNADHLCYFATSGAYSSATDLRADPEGYVPIVYGDSFTRDFYNDAEIIHQSTVTGTLSIGGGLYHHGNVISPGAEQAITFKLGLPEPCVGDFSDGDIFFWGEAI